jgi:hypothetical protein
VTLIARLQASGRSMVEVKIPAETSGYVLCEMLYSFAHALVLDGLATPAQLDKVVNDATLKAVAAAEADSDA